MNIFDIPFKNLLTWAWDSINQGQNPLIVARGCIDRIDKEIIRLLSLRYEIVEKIVVSYKKAKNLPFRDRIRENEMIGKLTQFAKTTELPTVMVSPIFRSIIDSTTKSEMQTEDNLQPILRRCHRCNDGRGMGTFGIVILEEPHYRVCPICKDPLM